MVFLSSTENALSPYVFKDVFGTFSTFFGLIPIWGHSRLFFTHLGEEGLHLPVELSGVVAKKYPHCILCFQPSSIVQGYSRCSYLLLCWLFLNFPSIIVFHCRQIRESYPPLFQKNKSKSSFVNTIEGCKVS